MKQVFKWHLNFGYNFVSMPANSMLLTVREQCERVTVWFLCDPSVGSSQRKLLVVGTGHVISDANIEYVGTALLDNGQYVWHVFEVKENG